MESNRSDRRLFLKQAAVGLAAGAAGLAAGAQWSAKGQAPKPQVREEPVGSQQAKKYGVGLLLAFYGQSNIYYLFQPGATGTIPDAYSSIYWGALGPYKQDNSLGGKGWPAVLIRLRKFFGGNYPFRISGTYEGGTAISGFIPGSPMHNWENLVAVLNDTTNFGLPRFVIWWQGEGDFATGSGYASNLDLIVNRIAAIDTRSDYRFGIIIPGVVTGGGATDAGANIVRGALLAKSQQPGCFFIGSMLDGNGDAHPTLNHLEPRLYNAILYEMGLSPYGNLGLGIGAAYWPLGSSTLTIYLTQDSGGTSLRTGNGATSGRAISALSLANTSKTIARTAFSGNTIVCMMSAVRDSGDSTAAVHYAEGRDPYNQLGLGYTTSQAGVIYDNNGIGQGGPLSNTLRDTVGLPLRGTNGRGVPASTTKPF
jgi:hypothetical protein